MTRIHKIILVIGLTAFGVWGCSRPAANAPSADRSKPLEQRVAKLEADLQAAAAARDATLARLVAAEDAIRATKKASEEAQQAFTAKVATLTKERDIARADAKAYSSDRDKAQAEFASFRSQLRELLSKADAAAAGNTPAATIVGGAAFGD